MARKSLLRFIEPDGRVQIEMLGESNDFVELVDPNDGSVLHAGAFVMHDREWVIESVAVIDDLTVIECVSTVQASVHRSPDVSAADRSNHRSSS